MDGITRRVWPARKIDNHIHVERIDLGRIDRSDSHRHLKVIDLESGIVRPDIPRYAARAVTAERFAEERVGEKLFCSLVAGCAHSDLEKIARFGV